MSQHGNYPKPTNTITAHSETLTPEAIKALKLAKEKIVKNQEIVKK